MLACVCARVCCSPTSDASLMKLLDEAGGRDCPDTSLHLDSFHTLLRLRDAHVAGLSAERDTFEEWCGRHSIDAADVFGTTVVFTLTSHSKNVARVFEGRVCCRRWLG